MSLVLLHTVIYNALHRQGNWQNKGRLLSSWGPCMHPLHTQR